MDERSFKERLARDGFGEAVSREWEAGTVNGSHTHDFAASALVISGEITVTTEDGATTCRAGDSFTLAAGIAHTESVGGDGVRFLVGRK